MSLFSKKVECSFKAVVFKPVLQAPLPCTFCMSPLSDTPISGPFLNTKFTKFGLAFSVVRTSQVRLGSANSRGWENTSPVILQMEQQCT